MDERRRSAEKDRAASSCKFADRVASLSIEAFRQLCPAHVVYQQTVVATIALLWLDSSSRVCLKIVSLGVGTKTLSADQISMLRQDRGSEMGDELVRDMHAEVLARRGFVQFMMSYIAHRVRTNTIFDSEIIERDGSGVFRLRSTASAHLYSSSQPCGNACIKRWAKSKKIAEHPHLSENEVPLVVHPPYFPVAVPEGEVEPLVKSNNNSHQRGGAIPRADHIPAGTASVESGLGNIMSCSDKLAAWNFLGLQGSLLTLLPLEPVYLHSITVGRKFGEAHCRRALCCRIAKLKAPSCGLPFRVNHPSLLTSKVKLDHGSVAVSADDRNNKEAGADFGEARCLVAWLDCLEGWDRSSMRLETLDGRTGLLESGGRSSVSSRAQAQCARAILEEILVLPSCTVRSTLQELKLRAVGYQQAKRVLRSRPSVLATWASKPAPA